jgi:ABC-type amino acid transport substrate-binding protein
MKVTIKLFALLGEYLPAGANDNTRGERNTRPLRRNDAQAIWPPSPLVAGQCRLPKSRIALVREMAISRKGFFRVLPREHWVNRGANPRHRYGLSGSRELLGAVLSALVVSLMPLGTDLQARPFDEVVESGTLRIAVYRDFPPFSYHREGRLVGVDVDLGRSTASQLGVRPSFMPITADENVDDDLRNAVWKGHYLTREVADLMLHVPIDRQLVLRNNLVAFFAPYFSMQFAVAYDPEEFASSPDLHAFIDRKVGVELDSLPDFYLTTAYGGVMRENVVHFSTVAAATAALVAGDVAAVMAPQSQIEAGLGPDLKRFELSPFFMHGFGRSNWLVGVAVNQDSRDLGYAVEDIIAAMMESGVIEQMFSTHGISYRPPDLQ